MSRYLLVDVGAGTMDVLCYDDEAEQHYKAVVRSPVRSVADLVAATAGNLVVTGGEMGGGPVCAALKDRAKVARVAMTAAAASTIHHDEERVRAHGIEIVAAEQAEALAQQPGFTAIRLADVDAQRLEQIVKALDVPFAFDVAAICVQDHGVPPTGTSHLDYRHQLLRLRIDDDPHPAHLLMAPAEIPASLNRCRSAAADAAALPAAEVYVMDSGMAAIAGARRDPLCCDKQRVVVLDVATSHTIAAAFDGDELTGFFEYHTRDITTARLDALVVDMVEGRLEHRQVLAEGGHGAYCRAAFGFGQVEVVLATGPKRSRIAGSQLPLVLGAPLGDNMMTGTAGLLDAIRRRKGAA